MTHGIADGMTPGTMVGTIRGTDIGDGITRIGTTIGIIPCIPA